MILEIPMINYKINIKVQRTFHELFFFFDGFIIKNNTLKIFIYTYET